MRRLRTVTLPERDWRHVVNAVDSSFRRKMERRDFRAADEMMLIGKSIIRQCEPPKAKKEESEA